MVISQGKADDRVIETDTLCTRLAEDVNFEIHKRIIANRRVITKDRTVKIGRALESILIMSKPAW